MRIDLSSISKSFGSITANENVDLTLNGGEIHALLGENGAGKSTLMNILSGQLRPDSGRIEVDGKPLPPGSARAALDTGIWMVHQHFMLVGPLTVEENLLLSFRGSKSELHQRVKAAAETYQIQVDLKSRIEDLTVGAQQRVEILKGIVQDARCLILDEPTSVLAEAEVAGLIRLMRTLAAEGRIVLLITHKIAEVLESSDRVTVMRAGRIVGEFNPKQATHSELVTAVVGGSLEKPPAHQRRHGRAVVSIAEETGEFSVHQGEVFGIAGVDGNGQVELAERLAGLRGGANLQRPDRIGYIPQDRMRDGLAGSLSILENLALHTLSSGKSFLLPPKRDLERGALQVMADFDVRPKLPHLPVERLSGGNQQKVVLARELGRNPELLVAVQPTRGLDPGAAAFVRERILQAATGGAAVVYVSTDLDELFQVADRIGVLYRGRLAGIAERDAGGAFPRERIGEWMTGVVA